MAILLTSNRNPDTTGPHRLMENVKRGQHGAPRTAALFWRENL